ncbi:arylamine N-acetyltransferase [Bacillus sp. Marseille-Q3570]|uniref:arylamine N-acetyltransferase family protein n=1 Tax=Bacillus sp. Marseille-Q3570 TaxID=2963522 RepID=UPI0021B82816|nr:arylamine N-acetyltransferase [Bacillus sp. Marseille-Q3570]
MIGGIEVEALFRKRIGLPEDEPVTFEKLDEILEKTARTIPFENMRIMNQETFDITNESLIDKMLARNEGGLCYELNGLLYLFLLENGFDVTLVRGDVFNNEIGEWTKLGRTHVAIILHHEGQDYIVDTGFGGNLPLKPVPMKGEVVTSSNGQFKVEASENEYGDYVLMLKLADKDKDWRIGHVIDSKKPVTNLSEFNEIQKVLIENERSPFNKGPILMKFTDNGTVSLTDKTLTRWIDGKQHKENITETAFKEYVKNIFGIIY